MTGEVVSPTTLAFDTLAGQLRAAFEQRLAHASDVRIEGLARPVGAGRSHETILFDASWTTRGERVARGCVLRVKPTGHAVFPDDLFEQQYRIMEVMHASGNVRVARPLWFEPDPTLLGAPFFVMEKLRGRVALTVPSYAETGWVAEATPAQRRQLWENGVRQLAAIQSVPPAAASFLRGPAGAEEGLAQEWDKYVRFLAWVSGERDFAPIRDAMARLERTWPANRPAGIVWGDARIGNLMYEADGFDVVAVMDWEQPSLGGALHDLGWWLYMSERVHGARPDRPWPDGIGSREETIALWGALTGIATDEIEWYEAFAELKLTLTGVRMAALRGWEAPTDAALAARLRVPERQ